MQSPSVIQAALREHPNICVSGVHHGQKAPTLRAGVPASDLIELVRSGRSPESLAKEFEPTAQAIRNWVAQSVRGEGTRDEGLKTEDRDEINRLRREVRQLKLERDILSKAAAWFARETDVIPSKGSNW